MLADLFTAELIMLSICKSISLQDGIESKSVTMIAYVHDDGESDDGGNVLGEIHLEKAIMFGRVSGERKPGHQR